MNIVLKRLVAAAALAGVYAPYASAQDYTWTFTMPFGDVLRYGDSGNQELNGFEPYDANASGTFTVNKRVVGPNTTYTLINFSFTTTPGTLSFGDNPTEFSNTYAMSDPLSSGVSDDNFDSHLLFTTFNSNDGNTYTFDFYWDGGSLTSAMTPNQLGVKVNFSPLQSFEMNFNTGDARLNGACDSVPGPCIESVGTGFLQLTNVPEPASMALMGAGLLGLFAARRRKSA